MRDAGTVTIGQHPELIEKEKDLIFTPPVFEGINDTEEEEETQIRPDLNALIQKDLKDRGDGN